MILSIQEHFDFFTCIIFVSLHTLKNLLIYFFYKLRHASELVTKCWIYMCMYKYLLYFKDQYCTVYVGIYCLNRVILKCNTITLFASVGTTKPVILEDVAGPCYKSSRLLWHLLFVCYFYIK